MNNVLDLMPRERESLARDPRTGADTLMQLARDPDEWVRFGVVHNPRTPRDALILLAGDPNAMIRHQVLAFYGSAAAVRAAAIRAGHHEDVEILTCILQDIEAGRIAEGWQARPQPVRA